MTKPKRLFATTTAALALAAAVLVATSAASAESNGGVRVMPLGDSITDGLTVPGGYRNGLWQRLASGGHMVDFVGSLFNGPSSLGDHDHEGHSGWRIDQIDANIASWLRTTTPRTILLHIGTNDMVQNPTNASTRLATLIDRITAQAPTTELFVATIIPLSGRDSTVRSYNTALTGIVQARASAGKRVHLVDMYNALSTADLADGVHPNAGGYSKMAAVWYNALLSVPGSLTPPSGPSPSPSTSPSQSTSPSPAPSPTGGPGGCSAASTVQTQWQGGYVIQPLTVTNTGTAAISGWTVTLTLPAGHAVTGSWNTTLTLSGQTVTLKNVGFNGTLAPGASTASVGFQASRPTSDTKLPSGYACTSP